MLSLFAATSTRTRGVPCTPSFVSIVLGASGGFLFVLASFLRCRSASHRTVSLAEALGQKTNRTCNAGERTAKDESPDNRRTWYTSRCNPTESYCVGIALQGVEDKSMRMLFPTRAKCLSSGKDESPITGRQKYRCNDDGTTSVDSHLERTRLVQL